MGDVLQEVEIARIIDDRLDTQCAAFLEVQLDAAVLVGEVE